MAAMDERAAARTLEWVEAHIDKSDGCWLWTGTINASNGYGQASVRIDGKPRTIGAHRMVYEHLVGPIPEGLDLDHLCNNKNCVNPAHLDPVTHMLNTWRSHAHRYPHKWPERSFLNLQEGVDA